MTIKVKVSLLVSSIFTVLFGIAVCLIYILFSNFRKDEFESRLKEKAISSIKLLIEDNQIDKAILRLIDSNSINKLYDEKTLLFDENFHLIYSSLDDAKIAWSLADLEYLKKHKTFFKNAGKYEVYGAYYDTNQKDYYALISASDNYGKRKLEYLLYILIATYILFTSACWFITFYVVKKLLLPLNDFHQKIKSINEKNLDTRIIVKERRDEIDLLAFEFNQMLHRIDEFYQKQKEFTSNASHELRTPVARVTSQLENRMMALENNPELKQFFGKILEDINQISELISSLLLLSKLDDLNFGNHETHRLDELIYEAIEKLNKSYPEFKILFDIEYSDQIDSLLEIRGNKSLLGIAIMNLLKNACIYSDNKQAKVLIAQFNNALTLMIFNNGPSLSPAEQKNLFQPFMRGNNASGKSGLGLGLRIVERILKQHHASIAYDAPDENTNIFRIIFRP